MIVRSTVAATLTLVIATSRLFFAPFPTLGVLAREEQPQLRQKPNLQHSADKDDRSASTHGRSLQDLDLDAEDVKIRFAMEFWNYTGYLQPGYVCDRKNVDWNKKDVVRVCRGLTKNQPVGSQPSCWLAFQYGIDLVGDTAALDPTPNVNRNAAFLSSTGTVPVHSGLYTEFSNSRMDMTNLFRQVCYDNGNLSAADIAEVTFQGMGKAGSDALVAAHYFTSGSEPSVFFPADRTNMVVMGLVKPFEKFEDPDQRIFKSVTAYHTLRYSTQGSYKNPQETLIDGTYFYPKGPIAWVYTSDSIATAQKFIVKRRTRKCSRVGWLFRRCLKWGTFTDDGFFIVSDWKDAQVIGVPKFDLGSTHSSFAYREWSELAVA